MRMKYTIACIQVLEKLRNLSYLTKIDISDENEPNSVAGL